MAKFLSLFLFTLGSFIVVWVIIHPMTDRDMMAGIAGLIMLCQGLYCITQKSDHWCNDDGYD